MLATFALEALLLAADGSVSSAGDAERASFAIAGASAGTAWDSNVTRTATPEGDVAFEASAHGGVGWAGDAWGLSAMALYRGRLWLTASDLATHALAAAGLVTFMPSDWLTVGLGPGAGYTLAADPARTGPRLDARTFVRLSPADWLSVRAGYGYLVREAADPTLATRVHEATLLTRFAPLEWLSFTVAWSFTTGADVVYREASATPAVTAGGRRAGARWSTGSTAFEAVPVLARTHVASAGVELDLPRGFSVALDVAWVASTNEVQPWTAWTPSLAVAWDLP